MRTVGRTFQEIPKHICPLCGKEYKAGEALAKHIKDKHPDAAGPKGSGGPPRE